jgi:hypothetical protein
LPPPAPFVWGARAISGGGTEKLLKIIFKKIASFSQKFVNIRGEHKQTF